MNLRHRLVAARAVVSGALLAAVPVAWLGVVLAGTVLGARRARPAPRPDTAAERRRSRLLQMWFVVGAIAWWWGVGGRDPWGAAAQADAALAGLAGAALLVARRNHLVGPGRPASAALAAAGAAIVLVAMAAASLLALLSGPAERAVGWAQHPNVWGATAVSVAAVTGALAGRARHPVALAALAPALVVVAATGSRSALVAWSLLASWAAASALAERMPPTRHARRVAVGGAAVGAVVALVLGGGALLLGQRVDALARLTFWAPGSVNLVLASEEVGPPFWTERTVTVASEAGADGWSTHLVVATVADPIARVHQRVDLAPGAVRTLSVDVRGADDPGIVAFAEPSGRLVVDAAGVVRTASGPVAALRAWVEPVQDGVRLHVTVRNEGVDAVVWRLGLAPSLAGRAGAAARFARPALTVGDEPAAYAPTTVADRTRELAARTTRQRTGYVIAAGSIVRASPWWGHGATTSFEDLARAYAPGLLEATDRPSHSHMLWTDLLVTRGVFGTLGFAAALAALAAAGDRAARRRLAPVVLVVAVANTFDLTFWTPAGAMLVLSTWLWTLRSHAEPATGSDRPARDRTTVATAGHTLPPAGR